MKKEAFKYTATLLNWLVINVKDICSSGPLSWNDDFINTIQKEIFNPIKDNDEYKNIFKR